MPIYGPYIPNPGNSSNIVDGMPTFSVTVTGQAPKEPSLSDWLFGNPIKDQLNVGMASNVEGGPAVQNLNWQQATNANGIMRTMNETLAKVTQTAQQNKQLFIAAGVFVGVIVLAKSLGGNKRR